MSEKESLSRRKFLQATLAGSAALAAGPLAQAAQSPVAATQPSTAPQAAAGKEAKPPLPTRKLGRTGLDVTIWSLGGMMEALYQPRFIEMAWDLGTRFFDTADCYLGGDKSEQIFGEFYKRHPERRKQSVLCTKDHPKQGPKQLAPLLDKRLSVLGLDYVDIFYLHGLGAGEYGEGSYEWPKSQEFKETCEQIKKSGKAKFVGFTCHDPQKIRYLQAAAEGGFIDVIMFAYDPLYDTGDDMKNAIEACHKAGIGLIAMKVLRPHDKVPARLPELDKIGLTTRQAILHACWADERFATICSNPNNTREMEENIAAARLYKGSLDPSLLQGLKQVAVACRPSICPNCDGRCARAAGVELALADIARYVNYYERDGRLEARDLYHALEEAKRRVEGADLAAAQHACHCQLDFAEILAKAERYFA